MIKEGQQSIKVMLGVPSRNNSWWSNFGQSLAMLVGNTVARAPFISLLMDNTVGTGLAMNRIKLCKRAIEKECDFILFLDDDMVFPPDTLLRLLDGKKHLIAANCARKELPPRSTAQGFAGECVWTRKSSTGIEEVKTVGTAVMLVSTEMLKNLPQPWFLEDPVKGVGEDVYFCNHARDHGFKTFIDHDLSKEIGHMGGLEFTHQLAEEWEG